MILRDNYICALDIGSSKIAACAARIKRGQPDRLFFETIASRGVREGAIVNSIDLVGAVGALMKSLKSKSGINIKSVSVDISGRDILTKHSRAIVPLAERGNKVITASDMQKAAEQARILGSTLEEEIIHLVPSSYSIDSKTNITNPLGLYSHGLEVDLYLVCVRLSSLQSLTRAINQSGYEVDNVFFSGLAASQAVFGKELQQGIHLFCDIGSDTTEIVFFRSGIPYHIEVLAVGGDNLTAELQEEFRIPFELAEDIKRSHGIIGDPAQIAEDKEILVKKSNFYKPIKQKAVSEAIIPRAKASCLRIREAVEKKVPLHQIDSFTAAGRSMLLEGFIETLENTLSVPVKIGRINNPALVSATKEEGAIAGQKCLGYLTAVGVLCQALQEKQPAAGPALQEPKNFILKAVNKFKEAYQEYF